MPEVDFKQLSPNKNADGHLGPICNNCGGFGYTLGLKGERGGGGCHQCNQTGVATPTNQDLENRVASLETEIRGLKNLIIKELGKR